MKNLNIYMCLIHVYIFKDDEEYFHIIYSLSLRKIVIAIDGAELETTWFPGHWLEMNEQFSWILLTSFHSVIIFWFVNLARFIQS